MRKLIWAALSVELGKQEPAVETMQLLERKIPALDSSLTEKRLEHILDLKKISPDGPIYRPFIRNMHGKACMLIEGLNTQYSALRRSRLRYRPPDLIIRISSQPSAYLIRHRR